jgi:hypothetical protein
MGDAMGWLEALVREPWRHAVWCLALAQLPIFYVGDSICVVHDKMQQAPNTPTAYCLKLAVLICGEFQLYGAARHS